MDIGRRIHALRIERKVSQKMLAEFAEVSQAYISDLEHDRHSPTVDVLLRIAKCLGVSISDLVNDDMDPDSIVFGHKLLDDIELLRRKNRFHEVIARVNQNKQAVYFRNKVNDAQLKIHKLVALNYTGQYDDVIELSLGLLIHTDLPDYIRISVYTELGIAYMETRRFEEALAQLHTACNIVQHSKCHIGHRRTARLFHNIGRTYANLGDDAAALQYLKKASEAGYEV